MRKALKVVVLVGLVGSSVLVVGSPAFATPNLTASSGNAPVAPFITPSTSTRSQVTVRSTDPRVSLPSLGVTMTCRTSSVSGYSSTTHTQLRLTSLSFGDDQTPAANSCILNSGSVVEPITCTATSARSWSLHVRSIISGGGARGSASMTVNLTSGCVLTMRLPIGTQQVTIDPNQSCVGAAATDNTYTWDTSTRVGSLSIRCRLRVTIQPINITAIASTFEGAYTVRSDTARDVLLSVTAGS